MLQSLSWHQQLTTRSSGSAVFNLLRGRRGRRGRRGLCCETLQRFKSLRWVLAGSLWDLSCRWLKTLNAANQIGSNTNTKFQNLSERPCGGAKR